MTDQEWRALCAAPGAQARHQALEILRHLLDDCEEHVPAALALRRWAVAVLARADTGIPVSEGA